MTNLTLKILGQQVNFHLDDGPCDVWIWMEQGYVSHLTLADIKDIMKNHIKKFEGGKIPPILKEFKPWHEIPTEEKLDFIKKDIRNFLALCRPLDN